jgi:tetratricopeptide (TPR) repeat protein
MKKLVISIAIISSFITVCLPQDNSQFLRGVASLHKSDYLSAEDAFSKSITAAVFPVKCYYYRGIARMESGNFVGSVSDLKTACDSNYTAAFFKLAELYAGNNNADKAIFYLQLFLSKNSSHYTEKYLKDPAFKPIYSSAPWQDFISDYKPGFLEQTVEEANYFIKKHDFYSAHTLLDKALLKQPDAACLHTLKAISYMAEGLTALACQQIKKSVELDPKNAESLGLAGDCYTLNHDYSTALGYYEKLRQLNPEDFGNYLKIARTDIALNKISEAANNTDLYLSFLPTDTTAVYLSAKIKYIEKDYTSALKQLNQLMKEHAPHADWFLLRGLVYYETGTYKYASADLSMSLDLNPGNAKANYYLGNAEFKLGNKQLACYYWKRAQSFGEFEAVEQLLNNCSN